jgi:predicted metal-dependent HD superfamily phosphohydrolase
MGKKHLEPCIDKGRHPRYNSPTDAHISRMHRVFLCMKMNENMNERWQDLWRRIGAISPPEPTWERLAQAYSQPHRAYHNLEHIQDCLAQWDWARHTAAHENEVETALWLHDVIYDPHASDNEERSADWAVNLLQSGRMDPEFTSRVRHLILATRHQALPDSDDAALLVDIDLSILGREPEAFDRYEAQIRREYQWVPEDAFREGRARILEGFLNRTAVFQTPAFQQRYEAQARENLARSIRNLRSKP